jgi:chemotaxis protein methyltransferase CheR
MTLADEIYDEARDLVGRRLGLDFPANRRSEFERALAAAAPVRSAADRRRWLDRLRALPTASSEWRELASRLTIGETYFFRDEACFAALERELLPELIATRRRRGNRRLRIWSAGCATGEEPYSLAIVLDRLLQDRDDWTLTILATDVDTVALQAARRGLYRSWSFRGTPSSTREQYFRRRGARSFQIDRRLLGMVSFAPLNLNDDAYPSPLTDTNAMDLVLCRNVLMHFSATARRLAAARLAAALLPGGWFITSAVEADANVFRELLPITRQGAIFFRKPGADAGPPPEGRDLAAARAAPPSAPCAPAPSAEATRPAWRGSRRAPAADPAEASLDAIRELANRGDLEEAGRALEIVLARDRLDVDAHLLLAAIRREQGRLEEASGALRRAIYLRPDSAAAYLLLGSLLLQRGARARAARAWRTLLALLAALPDDEEVPGCDGFTAGRLRSTAAAYLEMQG